MNKLDNINRDITQLEVDADAKKPWISPALFAIDSSRGVIQGGAGNVLEGCNGIWTCGGASGIFSS